MPYARQWDDLLIYLMDEHSVRLAASRLEGIGGPWPDDPSHLEKSMAMASRQGLQELLMLHLLARALCQRKSSPSWVRQWLKKNRLVEALLPGLDHRQALAMSWTAVPVPMVDLNMMGSSCQLILAPRPGTGGLEMPQWAQAKLERGSQEALAAALEAARAQLSAHDRDLGFYCWPLLDPAGPMIRGASLGLPVAIAMCLATQGAAWPQALMATGDMDPQGRVGPIGGLESKVQVAAEAGVKLFLYPEEERVDFPDWPVPALPVSDLNQAMVFSQLLALGVPAVSNFRLYYSCLQDPDLMVDTFHHIPTEVLTWARDRGLGTQITRVADQERGFSRLVARLEDCCLPVEHRRILGSLLGDRELERLAARSSQDALNVSNWYRCLLTLAAEAGDIQQVRKYKRRAAKIFREFGNNIFVFYRTEEHQPRYRHFDQDLGVRLSCMPRGVARELVEVLWRHRLLYMHLPTRRGDHISARVFFSPDNQIVALSLNALALDIDLETGQAHFIDDCVHAAYLGLMRATYVVRQEALLASAPLHRHLAEFLTELVADLVIAPDNPRQVDPEALAQACHAYYAGAFLGLGRQPARRWAPGHPTGQGSSHGAAQRPLLEDLLAGAGLIPSPEWLSRRVLAGMGPEARHALSGVLDHLIAMCVLAAYPTNLFECQHTPPTRFSRPVEALLEPHLRQLRFATTEASLPAAPGQHPHHPSAASPHGGAA